jgi:hypothetical protein
VQTVSAQGQPLEDGVSVRDGRRRRRESCQRQSDLYASCEDGEDVQAGCGEHRGQSQEVEEETRAQTEKRREVQRGRGGTDERRACSAELSQTVQGPLPTQGSRDCDEQHREEKKLELLNVEIKMFDLKVKTLQAHETESAPQSSLGKRSLENGWHSRLLASCRPRQEWRQQTPPPPAVLAKSKARLVAAKHLQLG